MTASLTQRLDRWRRRNGLMWEGSSWPPIIYQALGWYGGLSDARAGLLHAAALLFAAATASYLLGGAWLVITARQQPSSALVLPIIGPTETPTPDLPTDLPTALPTVAARPTSELPRAVIEAPLPTRVPPTPPPPIPTEPPPVVTDIPAATPTSFVSTSFAPTSFVPTSFVPTLPALTPTRVATPTMTTGPPIVVPTPTAPAIQFATQIPSATRAFVQTLRPA